MRNAKIYCKVVVTSERFGNGAHNAYINNPKGLQLPVRLKSMLQMQMQYGHEKTLLQLHGLQTRLYLIL